MHTFVRNTVAAFAVGAVMGAPLGIAAASSDHREFGGTVVHISENNIKVHGVEGGRGQTLSFIIDPKLTKLTHNGGKGTAELRSIHVGDTVKIRYDQKFLGVRHADAILDQTDGSHMKT